MNASEAGRNDPCPCGSGKKYKKCCWAKDQAATAAGAVEHRRHEPSAPPGSSIAPPPGMYESDVDRLSNSAADAIEAARFDEAQRLCDRLLQEHPHQIDGHERLGMLREAQGRFLQAADQYAQVLAMIEHQREGFDPEAVEYFNECRDRALSKLKS